MKSWKKPTLVVLMSNKSVENILAACKILLVAGGQPGDFNGGCQELPPPFCVVCSSLSGS